MTWRWKNIHFEAGDGGGSDDDAAARERSVKAAKELLGIDQDSLEAAEARLKIAGSLQEQAKALHDIRQAITRENIEDLKRQKERNVLNGMSIEQAELEFQTKLKAQDLAQKQLDTMVDLAGQTKSFASDWLMINDNTDGFTQSLWRAKGDMGQMAVFGYQAASAVESLLTPANIFQATIGEIVEGVSIMVMELESALPAFNATMGAAGRLNAEIVTATNEVRQYGVGMEAAAGATTSMASSLGNFNRMGATTRTELVVMAAGLERLGISTETSANLVNSLTRSLGMTTDAAQASIKSVAATAAALEMPVGKMVDAFDQAMPRLAQFGKDAPEVFKKMAAAAKATGIEVGALMGMVGQYDTWEGSAEAAGRLNAMLGGPLLNSIDLLKASDEERVRMLIGSMEASGKSWEAMSRFERQAFASAAGISDMNEAGKLFSTTLSEYDWQQQEAAEAADNAKAYNDMIQAAIPLAEKWKQVYMKAWGALGPLITPVLGILKDFADFLLGWNPWVLLVGGFTLWIGTMLILSQIAKGLARSLVGLATSTVQSTLAGQTDNAVKNQSILLSIRKLPLLMREIALDRLYAFNKLLGANAARLGWMTRKTDIRYSLMSIQVRLNEILVEMWANKVRYASAAATWALAAAKRGLNLAMAASPYLLAAAALFLLYKAFGPVGVAIGVLTLAVIAFNMGALAGPFGMIIMGAAAVVAGFLLLKKMGLLPLVGAIILVTAAVWSFNAAWWSSGIGAIIGVIGLLVLGFLWLGQTFGWVEAAFITLAAVILNSLGPIGWAIAAVGLLIYGIVTYWDDIVAGVTAAGKLLWGAIVWPFKKAWEWITTAWSFFFGASPSPFMQSIINGVSAGAMAIFNTLIYPFKAVVELMAGFMTALGAVMGQVAQAFARIVPLLPQAAAGFSALVPPVIGLAYATGIFAAGLWSAVFPLVIFTIAMGVLSLLVMPITGLAVALIMMSAVFAQWPNALAFASAIGLLAISFATLAVSLLAIASIAPILPLLVVVFTTLAVMFTLMGLSIALVATQMSNLMESMSELAGTGAVVTIGTSIKEVAEGINEASLVKTVALTGFMGATALAGAVGGGGGDENADLATAVRELKEEVAITNTLYREIASQPIVIKVGDQPIKKLVNQGIGDKIIAAVRANAATAGG